MKNQIKNNILNLISQKYNIIFGALEDVLIDDTEIFCTFKLNNQLTPLFKEIQPTLAQDFALSFPTYKTYISVIKENLHQVSSGNVKQSLSQKFKKISLNNIRHIVGIASGKGGVGKSTLTVNLAYALKELGLKVGILDGDIYGPSISFMMQDPSQEKQNVSPSFRENPILENIPNLEQPNFIQTLEKDGIKYNSVLTFMPNKDDAIVLKAPMIIKIFNQMIEDSNWGNLDILLIDLPPGTGDLQINLALKFNLEGIIIICTPQKLALLDAIKAIKMFQQTNVKILGVVENMSSFICSHCGKTTNIFDSQGAKETAATLQVDFLGAIPLETTIRELADHHTNIILQQPNHGISMIFKDIAAKIVNKIK
ncbi:ParA/NUBPL/Mrp/NBP35 family ATP-binding protein [Candidatus Hepatincolaceae symbiont of Richtersius coronifer]